jgi:protein transport protein SEC13
MVHDVQLDWHGRRLATCSSDRTIKIFQVDGPEGQGGSAGGQQQQQQQQQLIDTLSGHTGPVWAVSWAHPKFGSILASCSYDGTVLVWREVQGNAPQQGHATGSLNGRWEKIKEHSLHGASGA